MNFFPGLLPPSQDDRPEGRGQEGAQGGGRQRGQCLLHDDGDEFRQIDPQKVLQKER